MKERNEEERPVFIQCICECGGGGISTLVVDTAPKTRGIVSVIDACEVVRLAAW